MDKIVKFNKYSQRKDFSKIDTSFFEEPNLLESIRNSYSEKQLRSDLDEIFKLYFPISHEKNTKYIVHYNGILPFVKHKGYVEESDARKFGLTFSKALYADITLENTETGEIKKITKTKTGVSEGLYFGQIPQMTKNGTFIINGIEKNVVSQIVRAPGLYYLPSSKFKAFAKKDVKNICEIYPGKGSMMNVYLSGHSLLISIASIARTSAQTFTCTEFLKAFGMTEDQIMYIFANDSLILNSLATNTVSSTVKTEKVVDTFTRKNVLLDKQLQLVIKDLNNEKKNNGNLGILAYLKKLLNSYFAIEDKNSKKAIEILDAIVSEWTARNIVEKLGLSIRKADNSEGKVTYSDLLINSFMTQKGFDLYEAGRYKLNRKLYLSDRIYNKILAVNLEGTSLKAGQYIEKPEIDIIKAAFENNKITNTVKFDFNLDNKILRKQPNVLNYFDMYANPKSTQIIRMLAPAKFSQQCKTLQLVDFISIFSYASNINSFPNKYDDIENLQNKRIKLINEQLKAKLLVGVARIEKKAREKLASLWVPTATGEAAKKIEEKANIANVVSTKDFQYQLNSFFNTYQLTNFLDQQNPLSELSNKRKISAMGDGGISREDKNLNVRDIQISHYGRICPIEAPEGQNVGLIMALGAYAKIDEYGFIESPYRVVKDGKITDEVVYLTSSKESEHIVCDSSIPFDAKTGKILASSYVARYKFETKVVNASDIEYVEISPRQVLSVSTNLIPFAECNEGHRCEMAANMQRQAIPLLAPHAPAVGTGFEHKIALDSSLCLQSENDGVVKYVDSEKIIVGSSTYKLDKFIKSNQDTCINQKPFVNVGDTVKQNQVIADGYAMDNNEIALGQNINVAFISWNGYNFEDAVVLSERIFKEDLFTSIKIECIECRVLTTKEGDEEVTRKVPGISEEHLAYLDHDGLISIGTYVKEGDILVGKITPKLKTEKNSDEEKFFNILFGGDVSNYKNSSLKLDYGKEGVVFDIKRIKVGKNDNIDNECIEVVKIYIAQKRKIQVGDKLVGRHGNKGVVSIVAPVEDMPFTEDGTPVDICLNVCGVPSRMNLGQIYETHLGLALKLETIKKLYDFVIKNDSASVVSTFGIKEYIATNLIKAAKSYIDENKLKSLDIVDISIICRNVGITFDDLNLKISSPAFIGANRQDIVNEFAESGLDIKNMGKVTLYDGRTGNAFDNPVTVGKIYMLKLDHMIDDKIHARAVGSYSKITQQPLGGKRQNGGQRVGEMEVWAFEAYGAAYNLRELMTIKSDDVVGRNKAFRAILEGKEIPLPTYPSSFGYMTKLLQGLGLQLLVETNEGETSDANVFFSTEVPTKPNSKLISTVSSTYEEVQE